MSDAPKPEKPDDGWVMPEPVYRSSEGGPPKGMHFADPAAEIPTEPGFSDEDYIDTLTPDISDAGESPTAKPVKVTPAPPKPKKRGCARSFLTVIGLIALAVIGIVIALIYFLFYYKSADTSGF